MKVPIRLPVNRNNNDEEKNDYANFSNTKIIILFQVPQYEHLQILICNGNSLTTLAGVEHIKRLWKLDVGNNQIQSLQHLSRFIALGSLILSNNHLQWIELQHIRHMFVLDIRLDGNTVLDADPNYRQHVLDCLPRIWMCDGVFISTSEREQVEDFFAQSFLTKKPVRRKLARDIFMPTNLKDRSVNGLFGPKATDLFAKFPMNCFINSEIDKKRLRHLAPTMQDILVKEMKSDDGKKQDAVAIENRQLFYQIVDIRESHVEEFNMFLILLITHMLFQIPDELVNNVLDVTHINTIGNLKLNRIFSSSNELKCMVASLVHGGARIDRDENHPSAFHDKLFNSLSIILNNQIRQFSAINTNQPYPNISVVSEAKSMLCLEVMQVLIMCPLFYLLTDNSTIHAILQQALDRSVAYESVKNILENLNTDEKSAEEQRDALKPILGNIIKMAIRTLSTKKTKKTIEPTLVDANKADNDNSSKRQQEQNTSSPKPSQRGHVQRAPGIGDRILTGPQKSGRIVTLPESDVALIQFDHILAINGSMISNGSFSDHTNYVNMTNFEWDGPHEYWKPKFTFGDKITLHITTTKDETPRSAPVSRILPAKTLEPLEKGRPVPKLFEMNINKPREAFVDSARESTPPPSMVEPDDIINLKKSSTLEQKTISPEQITIERPMSARIIKQKQEQQNKDSTTGENLSASPVLIESTLLFMPDQSQTQIPSFEQHHHLNSSSFIDEFDHATNLYRRATIHRVPVPVHNATQWFNGPNMQNERSGRMEKVVSSLLRRSFRSISNYSMPRVPVLTSPSSREHAQYKGVRPGTFQEFSVESQRMTPSPFTLDRQFQSAKTRFTPSTRLYDLTH
ncbi:unnamed protein product [Adineta steineri]|uniref:Uncharacterized protein n=1 Tax=Adineta steineri TaxID=433720 RepID=A0A815X164_9BILA|nr:unnamed protein product [Adineta steineri]CAF1551677.1 unnamed protein product [Adineta steineri]